MTVTGVRAELRCGGRVAATLARWSIAEAIVMGDRPAEFAGDLATCNEFWIAQGPHALWLHMGGDVWWVWQRVEVRRPVPTVVATRLYGIPEVRRA